MIRRIALPLLTLILLLGAAGCHGFMHRHKHETMNAPSADVAHEFRQRWIAKRVSDLTAGGMSAPAAQTQAEDEYAKKYTYLTGSK